MKNLFQKTDLIRQNFFYYLLGFLIIFGIKYFYSKAGCEELKWILAPTAGWVELLSKIPFTYEKGTGYVNHSLRLLIAPSCSGVQFMLIAIAMLIFSFLHRIESGLPRKKFLWIAASLFLSYMLTVLVNGLRIIAAIYLPVYFEKNLFLQRFLSPEKLHTAIGIAVYFISLLTIYQLAEYAFQRIRTKNNDNPPLLKPFLHKCAAPVFWYFFMVLGIPFLNRASRKNGAQFADFALLVATCCGVILILYALIALLLRQKSRNKPKILPRTDEMSNLFNNRERGL